MLSHRQINRLSFLHPWLPYAAMASGHGYSASIGASVIELDDGKIYRKALYLMVKTHGFPVDFPLNQSIESGTFCRMVQSIR